MTTSDLDPDALEMARDKIGGIAISARNGLVTSPHVGSSVVTLSADVAMVVARAAITAYLTAREPGVTGKGEK